MDITPNKIRCARCREIVSIDSGYACRNCLAAAHKHCWTDKCPSFDCTNYDKRPIADYLKGTEDPPGSDPERLAQSLAATRSELVDLYGQGNSQMIGLTAIFFAASLIFLAIVGATNVEMLLRIGGARWPIGFLGVIALGVVYCCVLLYFNIRGAHALARIALVDARLEAMGRWSDGSARPAAAKKAA